MIYWRLPFLRPLILLPALILTCAMPKTGWRTLTLHDFVNVNGTETTWTEKNGVIQCSGLPLGGARTHFQLTNFELEVEWKHQTHAGNAGIFLWCPSSSFEDLPPGSLPRSGIEVQVLDLGYEENYIQSNGKPSDWFTSHGDIFPVGSSTMQAITPEITYTLEDGSVAKVGNAKSSRSFPNQRLTKPAGEWNHYAIRAENGTVRLWVNQVEVNGGTNCSPSTGYLALESEGALVEYRNLRIREIP